MGFRGGEKRGCIVLGLNTWCLYRYQTSTTLICIRNWVRIKENSDRSAICVHIFKIEKQTPREASLGIKVSG